MPRRRIVEERMHGVNIRNDSNLSIEKPPSHASSGSLRSKNGPVMMWQNAEDQTTETTVATTSSSEPFSDSSSLTGEESSCCSSSARSPATNQINQQIAIKTNHNRKRRAVASKTTPSSTSASARLPPRFMQPWHVVLGDTHSYTRTTDATRLLRLVKAKFKETHRGQERAHWIPLALEDFDLRLRHAFPSVSVHERGLVLIRCTAKAMSRIGAPHTHAYDEGEEAAYGRARDRLEALEFYLNSRDPPTLSNELAKHARNLENLRNAPKRPTSKLLDDFAAQLSFFQSQYQMAQAGDVMATTLLNNLSVIQALKKQWDFLQKECKPVTSAQKSSVGENASGSEKTKKSTVTNRSPPAFARKHGAAKKINNEETSQDKKMVQPNRSQHQSASSNLEDTCGAMLPASKVPSTLERDRCLPSDEANETAEDSEPLPADFVLDIEDDPEVFSVLEDLALNSNDQASQGSGEVDRMLRSLSTDYPVLSQEAEFLPETDIDSTLSLFAMDDEPTSLYYVTMPDASSSISMQAPPGQNWLEKVCSGHHLSDNKESNEKQDLSEEVVSYAGVVVAESSVVPAGVLSTCDIEPITLTSHHSSEPDSCVSTNLEHLPAESFTSFATFVSYVSSSSQRQVNCDGTGHIAEAEVLEITERDDRSVWDTLDFKDQGRNYTEVMASFRNMSLLPTVKEVDEEDDGEDDEGQNCAHRNQVNAGNQGQINVRPCRRVLLFRRSAAIQSLNQQETTVVPYGRRRRRPWRGVKKFFRNIRGNPSEHDKDKET